MLRITNPGLQSVSEQPDNNADQAKRNKRMALIHVGIALAVLAFFVFNTVSK